MTATTNGNQVKENPRSSSGPNCLVVCMRCLLLALISLGYVHYNTLQEWTDSFWSYLCTTWVYNSVYFETWWTTLCYAIIISVPYIGTKLRMFNKYKIDPTLMWQSAGLRTILLEAVEYCTPFMLLDTFTVKKYIGVQPHEWSTRSQQGFIQYTRALPVAPPSVIQLIYQLIASVLVYDFVFFVVHLIMHRNVWLYKNVHSLHHTHDKVHSRVTNQLSVTERVILVLSANQSLKIVSAHPLTRTLFVPVFISLLVENHCGYDMPFTLDKVVPFGVFGGSALHFKHHENGARNYQPFLTYMDKLLDVYRKWLKPHSNKIKD